MELERFMSFLPEGFLTEGRGKLTGSGATGEEHVRKYIKPHVGSKDFTHTLASEHDDLPVGSKIKIKKVVNKAGKYHVHATDHVGIDHEIPISKLFKPGEAPTNKGHDYETKFVEIGRAHV